MRFCPGCGAPLLAGAKFCIECGRQLGEPSSQQAAGSRQQQKAAGALPEKTGVQLTNTFIAVFVGITLIGLAAAAFILLRPIQVPPPPQTGASTPPAGGEQAGANSGQLPAGHPKIELPTEARTFIDKTEQEAKSKPKDVGAWVKLGTVAMRAALFDHAYYDKAAKAFGHVLELDPDNLDALRGIGDLDYDQQKYDEATAAYEHYLKKKPDDPEVRTDLGTMYLYTGNADQAIVQYKKAIALKPDFYQSYFNLGIAYGETGDKPDAAIALTKAIALAPDDERRQEAKNALTKYTGMAGDQGEKMASTVANQSAPAASSAGTFQSSLENTIRGLPVAGSKVSAIQWPEKNKAMVLMANFPMDQMPAMAKNKFMNDLKAGIDSAKAAHKVTTPVEVDIVDAQSGRVMQTVTE